MQGPVDCSVRRQGNVPLCALATAGQELGLDISDEPLEEMRSKIYDIDFEFATAKEVEVRHDVMGDNGKSGLASSEREPHLEDKIKVLGQVWSRVYYNANIVGQELTICPNSSTMALPLRSSCSNCVHLQRFA